MLAEAIQKITDLVRKAETLEGYTHEQIPETVWIRNGMEVEAHDVPPPRRQHRIRSLESFVAAVHAMPDEGKEPEVFYGPGMLVGLLDGADRRSMVMMQLEMSERFIAVRGLREPQSFSIRDAQKFLRFQLHDVGADAVAQELSSINVNRRNDGTGRASHGVESLGREVEASVQGIESKPQDFTATLNVFANPGLRGLSTTVRIGIFYDLQDEARPIVLQVLADEVTRAMDATVEQIRTELDKELPDVLLFHGAP